MQKIILSFLAIISLFAGSVIPALAKTPTGFEESVSASDVRQAYVDAGVGGEKVRILVVPGHEPTYGGAVYQGVYEREINVEIADKLAQLLRQNPRYDVIVARTNQDWNEDLADYFDDEMRDIKKFVTAQKKLMAKLERKGDVEIRGDEDRVDHAAAPDDVALRLYGINRWANENDVDLVLSIHTNDAPDHGEDSPSAYSGFAVYVPDSQYGNAAASRPIAESVAARIAMMNATSTLPVENAGVVEDQELIAIGAYGTLRVPSVLVEYSYITEPKFTHPEVRKTVTDDFAYETYLGLQDFFKDPVPAKYPTLSLPYVFTETPMVGSSSPMAYSLQAGLHTLGFYPPATTTATTTLGSLASTTPFNSCSISGFMDTCTVDAINAFQKSRGFEQTGALGPKTRAALNTLLN